MVGSIKMRSEGELTYISWDCDLSSKCINPDRVYAWVNKTREGGEPKKQKGASIIEIV